MTDAEKFMDAYKDYEAAVRAAGSETLKAEEGADADVRERLRICRQMRNYLAHVNDAGFLSPSASQVRFLTDQAKAWKMKGDPVKKHLKKDLVAYDADKCTETYLRLSKYRVERIPVKRDGKWQMLSLFEIGNAAMLKKTAKIFDVKALPGKVFTCAPEEAYADILALGRDFVCEDGAGKYLGTVV